MALYAKTNQTLANFGEYKIKAHSELFKMSIFNDVLENYKVLKLAYNKMAYICEKFLFFGDFWKI